MVAHRVCWETAQLCLEVPVSSDTIQAKNLARGAAKVWRGDGKEKGRANLGTGISALGVEYFKSKLKLTFVAATKPIRTSP